MSTTFLFDNPTDSLTSAPTHLVWTDADGQPRTEPLASGATTVGAGPRCAVRVAAQDARPLHCVVQRSEAGVTVRRWSSDTNLNGQSFTEAPLRVGDRLTVAGVELSVEGLDDGAQSPETDAPLETATAEAAAPALVENKTAETEAARPAASGLEAAESTDETEVQATDERRFEPEPQTTPGPPVPAHLLQPWLDAQPADAADNSPPGEETPVDDETSSLDDSPTGDPEWGFSGSSKETLAKAEPSLSVPSFSAANEFGEVQEETAANEPNARHLRDALQTARGRARRALAALRSEREGVAQVAIDRDAAHNSRDDLAAKLMLATTELHDYRSELEQAQHALNAVTTEASDHRWLFAAAQIEIDELEQRVAALRSEVESLTAERSQMTEQREQLEVAILTLEERLTADASAEPPLTADEAAVPESLFEASDAEPVVLESSESESDTSAAADPDAALEAAALNDFGQAFSAPTEEPEVAAETAVETPPQSIADPWAESASADNPWGDTPAAQVLPEEDEPGAAAESTPQASNPWSGVWGIEEEAVEHQDESADEANATGDGAFLGESSNDPGVTEADDEEQAADSWLASFRAETASENAEQIAPEIETDSAERAPHDDVAPALDTAAEDGPVESIAEQTGSEPSSEPNDSEKHEEPIAEPVAECPSPAPVSSLLEQAGILAPGSLDEVSPETSPETPSGDSLTMEPAAENAHDHNESEASDSLGFAPHADAPESVEALIADDQPSTEAPVSFIDKYADTLPADDAELAPPPAPPMLQQPAFDEPPASSGDGNEESIEDYMAKLMQRMRGEESAPSQPLTDALAPEPTPAVVATPTPSPAAEAAPEPAAPPVETAPLESLEELRRGPAPEAATDMTSLRDLANQTARSAIGVSEVKQDREQATVKLTIAGIAMGCGAFMAVTATSWLDPLLFVGVAGFGWSAYWFYGTLQLRNGAKAKESLSQSGAGDSPELPIAPTE